MHRKSVFAFASKPSYKLDTSGQSPTVKNSSDHASPVTIVIDNGSYECRAGYSCDDEPRLIFKSLAFKQKGKKENEPDVSLVSPEIDNLEAVRSQLKSPFDHNVVTQFDAQEMILDYAFSNLHVSSRERVSYPIYFSEPVCNPNHCRKYMSELLFECYSVPSVIYGVDALASWYKNKPLAGQLNGLIVSFGYQTTHIIPVLDGKIDTVNARRIAVGGYHLDFFMQRLLQLKYPIHSPAITLTRAEEIVQNHTTVASSYAEDSNLWLDAGFYDSTVRKMQLPYGNVPSNFATVAMQGERQVERARLVKEKQLLEKLEEKQHILDQLLEIGELTGTKLYRRLSEIGVDSLGELQCHIKATHASTEDLKRKIVHKDDYHNKVLTIESLQKKIDLLDSPDASSNDLSTFDVAEYYQLHVGIEQIRVPELLFQPSMLGIEQAGVTETMNFVLRKYNESTQSLLASNILLTGGCALIPGMAGRVHADLQCVRPVGSPISVQLAGAPSLDGWIGASTWLRSEDRSTLGLTKSMYDEMGGDHLLEHQLSNKFYSSRDVASSEPTV